MTPWRQFRRPAGQFARHLALYGLAGPPIGSFVVGLSAGLLSLEHHHTVSDVLAVPAVAALFGAIGFLPSYALGGPAALLTGGVMAFSPWRRRRWMMLISAAVGGGWTALFWLRPQEKVSDFPLDATVIVAGAVAASVCGLFASGLQPAARLMRDSPAPESGANGV